MIKKKRYSLEDFENGKLIMFQDVQFFEDNLPSELDIIDISMLAFSTNIIDKFVNDILAKDKSIITES